MRLRRWLAGALLPLALCASLWLVLPVGSPAEPKARLASLQDQISATRDKVAKKKGTEKVLTSDIARWSSRISTLQGRITAYQRQEDEVQADLDARRAQLTQTQQDLRSERARLARLRAQLVENRDVLAQRLVELYQADRPDLVTVILDSNGFADLLERGEFLKRIQDQDNRIIANVRNSKADATASAARLDGLEKRQQQLTTLVLQRRDEVARVKMGLVSVRVDYQRTRAGKQTLLTKVRSERQAAESHLSELVAESNRIQAQLQSGTGLQAGPIKGGSGRLIWPVNGPITAPFCESRPWEACHPGMDIGVPTGTPIRAADGGRVVIAGWVGGYGNYTCIQHTASLSTCYGHQSQINVSVGQQVSQGQIIGLSGSTGFSTGPHLHFEVRVNGAVQNPLNYL